MTCTEYLRIVALYSDGKRQSIWKTEEKTPVEDLKCWRQRIEVGKGENIDMTFLVRGLRLAADVAWTRVPTGLRDANKWSTKKCHHEAHYFTSSIYNNSKYIYFEPTRELSGLRHLLSSLTIWVLWSPRSTRWWKERINSLKSVSNLHRSCMCPPIYTLNKLYV